MKGGWSPEMTRSVSRSFCKRRTTSSEDSSHHPLELELSKLFHMDSKSMAWDEVLESSCTVGSGGSAMKGESKAIRSALSAYKRSCPVNAGYLLRRGRTYQVIDFRVYTQERRVIQISDLAWHQGQFSRSHRLRHLRVHVIGTQRIHR